jgi:hypothetical protein
MAPTSFADSYPQNPWEAVTTKERAPWYYPTLYREFARKAIYNRFVSVEFNHNGPKATELVIQSLIMPHANHDPIGNRQMWLDSSYMTTFNRRITFKRYGGKAQYNRYDDLITYLELDGQRGLKRIINEGFGYQMTHVMDKVARDAFLKAPFATYGNDMSGSSFADISTSDTFKLKLFRDIQLGLKERDNPIAVDETGAYGSGITVVTSPGVIHDLRAEVTATNSPNVWEEFNRYTESGRQALMNGAVGALYGVTFVETNNAVLYNCGEVIHRANITAPISAGDGTPDTAVDGLEYVGEPGATHFLNVDDVSGFSVGDYVTIHVDTTNAKGITNGVDWTDGKLTNRRIVALTGTTTGTVAFDRPILEDFKTQITTGVYGYITKGRNVHTMLFLYGNDGVAMGVAQPPTIHMPRPVDDLDMIQRITWDAYMGYQPFNKNAFEIAFITGSNRLLGPTYIR